MENITGRPLRVKKYSREESKEVLQKYAIDVASGVETKLQDINILEYITCLSKDDRYIFAHLEKKMRKKLIDWVCSKLRFYQPCQLVTDTVIDVIKGCLDNMTSDELVKIIPTFEKVDETFIADAIMRSLKESIES